jgi:hypothetical protein
MSFLLFESKRDNLLLPYITYLHENGIDVSLAEFKSAILKKLATEGGIRNLSQRSNFYLAGAARYYFNGDLTLNKPVSLLTKEYWENPNTSQDDWNEDVCKRLDALISVLRSMYIDSVGTTFEQPEDFGQLSIKQLFRKYGKKINKELGINTTKPEDEIDTNINVGNGYTFEIMYSQADCQKYERPTAPGSWCITYGKHHYDSYIRMLDIHYVIFRQNGWENIPRPSEPLQEPGFTVEKPHDKYGNSLIAVLQSNTSPNPIYITSRWNHGYGTRCEADHAYTKEEFEEITGVTDDDLRRIYNIWQKNKDKRKTATVSKKEIVDKVRAFKYAQMRINSGESPESVFDTTSVLVEAPNGKFSKSTAIVGLHVAGYGLTSALFDNGKIIFETVGTSITPCSNFSSLIICSGPNYNILYYRDRHKLVTVDGVYKFKHIPSQYKLSRNAPTAKYFMVKQTTHDIALIDLKTFEPLKLPNGAYWFNDLISNSYSKDYYTINVDCGVIGSRNTDNVIQIVYDISSGENYIYNTESKQFFPAPQTVPGYCEKYRYYGEEENDSTLVPKLYTGYSDLQNGVYGVSFIRMRDFNYGCRPPYALYQNGKLLTFGGRNVFSDMEMVSPNFIVVSYPQEDCSHIFNLETNSELAFFGEPIKVSPSSSAFEEHGLIVIHLYANEYITYHKRRYLIYDTQTNTFLHKKNTDGSDPEDYVGVGLSPNSEAKFGIDYYDNNEFEYKPIEDLFYINGAQNIDKDDVEYMVSEAINRILKKIF